MSATRPSRHAHRLVAETAEALCAELYETVMSNNAVRAEWKRQHPGASEAGLLRTFVRKNTAKLVPAARSTLAHMLATSIDEVLKTSIHEALVLDNTLLRGRKAQSRQLRDQSNA